MKSSLTDAAKELKENKTYLINNKLTVKSGKENSLDTLTLQTK